MSDDLVLYERRPPAAVLTLNRPDRRNALSRGLIAALHEAFARAGDDPEARCVVLTGAGNTFCAGMDLAELQEGLTAGHTVTHTHKEKMRHRGHWRQSEPAQAGHECVFRLGDARQAGGEMGRVLQGGDAGM